MKKTALVVMAVFIPVFFISSYTDSNPVDAENQSPNPASITDNNPVNTEDQLPTPEYIIEKFYTATGGKEAYEKIRNSKTELRIESKAQGIEVDFTNYKERPNKVYGLVDIGGAGKIRSGSDGKIAWEMSPFTGARVFKGKELASRLLDTAYDGPDAWKKIYKSVETEGVEDVNGRSCYKVVFTHEEGFRNVNYYDEETFLMLKTRRESTNQGTPVIMESIMEDYKKAAGDILVPHKQTRYVNGAITDIGVLKSAETNIEMPEGIFDLPEEIKRVIQNKKKVVKVVEPFPPVSAVAEPLDFAAFEMDLSPATWDPAEVTKYNGLNDGINRENMLAEGKNGVIAGALSPPAQRAGLEALRRGGTAMDAALTTSLTQIALAAGSYVSYAGVMAMVYYDAETGKYHNLNATWNTPLEEDDPMSIPRISGNISSDIHPDGRTALVPGYMAGVEAAHKRFGKLPFSALFTPAIYYAEKGFKVNQLLAGYIYSRRPVLSRLPETKRIFTNKETGDFYRFGEHFCQPELATTLRMVADRGASYMYTGEWAKRLVETVRRDGGKMTMEDLENYEVIWSEPLEIPYGEYTVYAHGLPASGGVSIAQALNVASEAGLSKMGHYAESPEAFFWLFQINNLSLLTNYRESTRASFLRESDPTLASLATKAHAQKLWSMMSRGEFALTKTPIVESPKHSEAVVAIDQWGNIAAMVHTCNTVTWGETGMFVDGISIPDAATWQRSKMLEIGPGKRLPDGMEPLIISKNGRPFVALASIGSGLHQATNSVLFNIMDFNMGLKEAVDAPSFHMPPQVYSGDFKDELLEKVKKMGLEVEVIPQAGGAPGWVIGAMIDDKGFRSAVPSKRGNGLALGY